MVDGKYVATINILGFRTSVMLNPIIGHRNLPFHSTVTDMLTATNRIALHIMNNFSSSIEILCNSYFYIEKWTFKIMCEVCYRAKRDKKEAT